MSNPARERAREIYARQFDALGDGWKNTAGLIRTGFENLWIKPALDAMEALVLLCPDEGEDEETGRA